ncbi:MAG: transposase [Planctomycetota bacterium]|nr:transposase [Planctomycetota bacterium]
MPRIARIVVPGAAHHVVQRSFLGHGFFFTDADRRRYLDLLAKYVAQHRLKVLAWCLLPNQVHLVVVPKDHDSLGGLMKSLNTRYSMHLRKTRKKWGLLHGRFFSCPMDEAHTWEAVRYVERRRPRGAAQGPPALGRPGIARQSQRLGEVASCRRRRRHDRDNRPLHPHRPPGRQQSVRRPYREARRPEPADEETQGGTQSEEVARQPENRVNVLVAA